MPRGAIPSKYETAAKRENVNTHVGSMTLDQHRCLPGLPGVGDPAGPRLPAPARGCVPCGCSVTLNCASCQLPLQRSRPLVTLLLEVSDPQAVSRRS